MAKYRVGLLGAGRKGTQHARAYMMDERVEVVEVADGESGSVRTMPTKEVFGKSMSAAVMVAAHEQEMWHNLRVDAHPNAIGELLQVYRDAQDSANRVAAFYKGAIRIKPYYWRRVGAPMK